MSNGIPLSLTSTGFQNLRMSVLLEGEYSFQIDCGVNFSRYLTVLGYQPAANKKPNIKPQLTSITFVPDFFVLKTPAELAASRAVVVEDDLLRRGRGVGTIERIALDESKPDKRFSAIAASLRQPQNGEIRQHGTLERIDCSGSNVEITTLLGSKRVTLTTSSPADINVSWFGVDASQVPLTCGAAPMIPNALFTFVPQNSGGILKAVEFVPAGFTLPSKN
jgi:hypothetical protein